jgi:hypothetical protein
MAAGPPTYQAVSMIEVLISYELPASLDESELRSWLAGRMQALSAEAVAFLPPESPTDRHDDGLVRFALDSDAAGSVEDRIADLVTDMRMLGLRPETVAVYHAPQRAPDTSRDRPSP